MDFPSVSAVKNLTAIARDACLIPGSERAPGKGNDDTSVFLPWKSYAQRGLVGYSPWGQKESDTTYQQNKSKKLKSVEIHV